jgi:hypothetical protein
MTLLLSAVALLLVGNFIARRGDTRCRAHPYHSLEYDRGVRVVSFGTVVNMVGGLLLVAGVISLF